MDVVSVVGARPNFMKAAPVHRAFERAGHTHRIVHTGQHYDAAMSDVFFRQLGMPEPATYLGVGSASHAQQTAAIMTGVEGVLLEGRPDMLLVVGDVNSTVGAALVASKLHVPVGHVEAGLRSRDWTMPEEVNRAVTDVLSDLLLSPSADADANLRAEGREPRRIVRVGNVMIDTLLTHVEAARARNPWSDIGIDRPGAYAVLTLHRPANVDDPQVLERLLTAVEQVAERLPVVFAVHPRTRGRLERLGWGGAPSVIRTEPLGYLDFLAVLSGATAVLTDSGGLQEESTALGIPCFTLRDNTERPITVQEGTNQVVGSDPDAIVGGIDAVLAGRGKQGRIPDLWDGRAAERIVDAVDGFLRSDHETWPR
jgi:UDP-N-acetylglucosamine 2-epimerase (non-hydrolysing)